MESIGLYDQMSEMNDELACVDCHELGGVKHREI